MAGLTYILFVDSEAEQVVFLSRSGEQWTHDDFDGREAAIPLPEIKCRLARADVYDGVTIEG